LKPDVAIEDSSLESQAPDGSKISNRYSVVWLKSEGRWLIGSARDLPIEIGEAPSPTYPKLQQFEWLIGDWQDSAPKSDSRLNCQWAPNKSCLLMEYTVVREGGDPILVTQRVGWDASEGVIRSWVYDSMGGFGEGIWEREGNHWVVHCAGRLPDGRFGSATNTYEFVDNNNFVWRGKDRRLEDHPLPDTDVKYTRKIQKTDVLGDRK